MFISKCSWLPGGRCHFLHNVSRPCPLSQGRLPSGFSSAPPAEVSCCSPHLMGGSLSLAVGSSRRLIRLAAAPWPPRSLALGYFIREGRITPSILWVINLCCLVCGDVLQGLSAVSPLIYFSFIWFDPSFLGLWHSSLEPRAWGHPAAFSITVPSLWPVVLGPSLCTVTLPSACMFSQ